MATWPTITDDDGTGTTGTILDQALFNSVRDYIGAAWTAVTYNAGNFTGSGTITWTVASGDQARFVYSEVGKTMMVSLLIQTSSVSGTGTELRVAIPNGRTASVSCCGSYFAVDNGTPGAGLWVTASSYIAFYIPNVGNWAASTNATTLYATCIFEIA